MADETAQQHQNSTHDAIEEEKKKKAHWLAPYQFKKGQSGNPAGRPKGKSLKEYAQEMLASMTDEERQEYLQGIDKRTIWEMAEGSAGKNIDLTTKGEKMNTDSSLVPQIAEEVARRLKEEKTS